MRQREEAMHAVIDAIDAFLRVTATAPGDVTAISLRELSHKIQKAQELRACTPAADTAEGYALCEAYRARIEQLQSRLAETEGCLRAELARVAEDNHRFARVREWHDLFTTTH